MIKKLSSLLAFFIVFITSVNAEEMADAFHITEFNQSYSKNIDADNNEHWWKFDVISGKGITATLTGGFDNGYLDVYLYNKNGIELNKINRVENGDTRYLNEQLEFTDTYYLKIIGTAIGSYDLSVYPAWYNTNVSDTDRALYASFETARYIETGNYNRASLLNNTFPLDDYFRFTANAGDLFSAELTGHFDNGSVDLFLYDVNGIQLQVKNNVEDGGSKELAETIHSSGTYYFKVSGNATGYYGLTINGANPDIDNDGDQLSDAAEYHHGTNPLLPDSDQDGKDDYLELTEGGKPLVLNEYQSNNTASSKEAVLPILVMNRALNSEITANTEQWWVFDAEESFTVALTGHFNNQGFVDVLLFNESGSILSRINNIEDGNTRLTDVKIEDSGTYYIQVKGAVIGNYDLTIYPAWQNIGVTEQDRAFYSSFNTSRELSPGSHTRSTLRNNGAPLDDYYRFTASEGTNFSVEATGYFNNGRVSLFLYDEDGTQLASKSNLEDGGKRVLTTNIGNTGYYFLKVSGDGLGFYDLQVDGLESSN